MARTGWCGPVRTAHRTHHGTHSRHCRCNAHSGLLAATGTYHLRRHIMVVGIRMAKSGCAPQCGEQCRRGSVPRTEALPQTRALLDGRHTGRMPGVNSHVLLLAARLGCTFDSRICGVHMARFRILSGESAPAESLRCILCRIRRRIDCSHRPTTRNLRHVSHCDGVRQLRHDLCVHDIS